MTLKPGTGEVASRTHSLRGQKGCVPLEPGIEVASGTHSLHGQKGHIASEPGIGEVASGTHSLCGQKEEHVVLDTG